MALRLLDVDVTQPLPDLRTGEGDEQDGVALVVRDGTRVVGLQLLAGPAADVPAAELAALVVSTAAVGLLEERLRTALTRDADTVAPPGLVTVAVCTRARPADLALCLAAIEVARQRWAGPVEVLVVDNAPPDDATEQVARHAPGVRYVREPVAGLDVARNQALAQARGEWLAFVDDDVRVDPDWLLGLAAARQEHPDAACVVGLVLPAQLETPAQVRFESRGGFGRGFTQRRWDGRHGPGGRLHPLGSGVFGAGCNMSFAVETVRALGGFDEALDTGPPLPGGGDLDMFFRVLAAGHPLVYEPRATVFHRHRRAMPELRRQYWTWGTGFAAYLGARWADPDERRLVSYLVVWWLLYQRRQLTSAVRRQDRVDVQMSLAELAGGVAGLGGYRRSRRRMAQRHRVTGLPQ